MKPWIVLAGVCLAIGSIGSASATSRPNNPPSTYYYLGGNTLFQEMLAARRSPGTGYSLPALRYIEGVVDAGSLHRAMAKHKMICLPHSVQIGQIYGAVWQYMLHFPQKRNEGASSLVQAALFTSFHCKRF